MDDVLIKRFHELNKKLYEQATRPLRSHGPDHHFRVCRNALLLVKKLGVSVDKEVLIAASMLHDLAAYYPEEAGEKYHDLDHIKAKESLENLDFPLEKIPAVLEAIAKHGSDPKYKDENEPVEISILRDADKLDVFGPLG